MINHARNYYKMKEKYIIYSLKDISGLFLVILTEYKILKLKIVESKKKNIWIPADYQQKT